MQNHLLLILFVCAAVKALDSGDNKFMKDYAMLKIYESCFGTTLLKQITKELKDAYAKCSSAPPIREHPNPDMPSIFLSKLPPGFNMDPNTQTITKPADGAQMNQENDLPNQDQQQQQKPIGGVLNFRPQMASFPQPAIPPYMIQQTPQFRPFSPAVPFYQFPYGAGYVPQGMPYNPFYPPPYQQYYQQPFVGSNRMSRQLGLRARLGMNRPRAQPAYNGTCVMQELGYIDQNMEPNYEHIRQRINNLPLPSELKNDIQEGLQFCQKFSQCVPDEKREAVPLPQEQIKSIFFFRCYKHKKLEACIMKDINEHFSKEYVFDTDAPDFATLSRSARSIRDLPSRDPSLQALEEMEVYLYDYLSGGSGFDFDLYI